MGARQAELPLPVPPPTLADVASQGPFVSGSVHKVWRLGQRVSVSDLLERPPELQLVGRRSAGASRSGVGGAGKRSNVTLADLVEAGILVPGRSKISLSYKGIGYVADLAGDGSIEYEGKRYGSATAFSIYCKRLVTPNKQGDDGWKSVLYEGCPLENFRKEHLARAQQESQRAKLGRPPPAPKQSQRQKQRQEQAQLAAAAAQQEQQGEQQPLVEPQVKQEQIAAQWHAQQPDGGPGQTLPPVLGQEGEQQPDQLQQELKQEPGLSGDPVLAGGLPELAQQQQPAPAAAPAAAVPAGKRSSGRTPAGSRSAERRRTDGIRGESLAVPSSTGATGAAAGDDGEAEAMDIDPTSQAAGAAAGEAAAGAMGGGLVAAEEATPGRRQRGRRRG